MSRKKQHAAFLAAATVAVAIMLAACGTAAATAAVAVVSEAPAPAPARTPETVTTSPTTAGPPEGWRYWPDSTEPQQEFLMMVATAEAQPQRTPPPSPRRTAFQRGNCPRERNL